MGGRIVCRSILNWAALYLADRLHPETRKEKITRVDQTRLADWSLMFRACLASIAVSVRSLCLRPLLLNPLPWVLQFKKHTNKISYQPLPHCESWSVPVRNCQFFCMEEWLTWKEPTVWVAQFKSTSVWQTQTRCCFKTPSQTSHITPRRWDGHQCTVCLCKE